MNRAQAIRVLGADVCIPESALTDGSDARSHLFFADDSTHKACAPKREVTEPYVLSGSERPTCVKCRAKYDAAVIVVNTVKVVEVFDGDVVALVKKEEGVL